MTTMTAILEVMIIISAKWKILIYTGGVVIMEFCMVKKYIQLLLQNEVL